MLPRLKPLRDWFALCACVALIGCSAESAGPNDDGGDDNNGVLTDEQQMAALAGVEDKVGSLAATDPDARREELLAYLRSRPEFEDAAIEYDGSLWARFTDGHLLLIIANREAATEADVPAASRRLGQSPTAVAPRLAPGAVAPVPGATFAPATGGRHSELPKSLQARFLLGSEPGPNVISALQSMVTSRKYTIAPNAGGGGLDDLKNVQGDGIFYISAHGGPGRRRDGKVVYAITSSTPVNLVTKLYYRDDWQNNRLVYALPLAPNIGPLAGRTVTYFAITSEFVTKYFRFAENSLVYIGACNGADPLLFEFAKAFHDQGASMYFSWSTSVATGDDYTAALYLFDRLLGLNEFEPESPFQRPFDWASTWANMNGRSPSLANTGDGAVLIPIPGTIGEFGLLAPSIENMEMEEEINTLTLTGQFGSERGRVEVDGAPASISSWGKEQIKVTIPQSGPGSAGDVVVFSRERKSNPRRLTAWDATFNLSFIEGHGTLMWEGPINVYLRADVHSYRTDAGKDPVFRTVDIAATLRTDGHLTASGSHAEPGSTPVQWNGTSQLANRKANPLSVNVIDALGQIDGETQSLRLVLFVTSLTGMRVIQGAVSLDLPAIWAYEGDGPLSPSKPLPAMYIQMDQAFGIPSGEARINGRVTASPVLKWNLITARFTPLADAPR